MTEPCKYEGKIARLETLIERDISYLKENVATAKIELERRLEGMNEFRAQLETLTKTFWTRDAIETEFNRQAERITALERSLNIGAGSRKWSDHIITVLIGAVVLIIVYFLRT